MVQNLYLDICIQINELPKVLWGDVILGGLKTLMILGNQGSNLQHFCIVNIFHVWWNVFKFINCWRFWGDIIGVCLSEKFSLKILGWCYPSKTTNECNCHYHFAVVVNSPLCIHLCYPGGDQRTKLCWVLHNIATLCYLVCWHVFRYRAIWYLGMSLKNHDLCLLYSTLPWGPSQPCWWPHSSPFLLTCLCSVTWATGRHRVTVH